MVRSQKSIGGAVRPPLGNAPYQIGDRTVAMFLPVFCPETSYNGRRVKFEKFCLKPYLRKDFMSLCPVVHWYYIALTQAV
ncbi:hypothetical protein [Microcystis aeruginosa]|nr:hypothetical protein OA58_22460 [Microcystis aeruginosa NIES-88]BCU12060.1 hypothetical protein MAN88_26240 [Microcystis aeruginosa]